ncbi:MAG TPA: hypothetical protein DIT05_08250 [Morganella sp. (in: Bacteria)]|nr:hypothetical protein [Morganella sp. (in: enterobacteria)]
MVIDITGIFSNGQPLLKVPQGYSEQKMQTHDPGIHYAPHYIAVLVITAKTIPNVIQGAVRRQTRQSAEHIFICFPDMQRSRYIAARKIKGIKL